MNDPTLLGPCADYEHDLVELNDGALPPERARIVRLHTAQCSRCRSWAVEFAALDARLAAQLPHPALSPLFESQLRDRIASESRPVVRSDLRVRLEHEHDSLLGALRRAARRRAALGAVASVTTTLVLLAALRDVLAQHANLLQTTSGSGWLVPGMLGALVVAGALAWSVRTETLPALGLGR